VTPVSLFVTTIFAFGIIAPVASVTTPAISPDVVDCAYKTVGELKTHMAPDVTSAILRRIEGPNDNFITQSKAIHLPFHCHLQLKS
jgi:hypothetical protein